jgi:hypothetical protein
MTQTIEQRKNALLAEMKNGGTLEITLNAAELKEACGFVAMNPKVQKSQNGYLGVGFQRANGTTITILFGKGTAKHFNEMDDVPTNVMFTIAKNSDGEDRMYAYVTGIAAPVDTTGWVKL